ncbi:hypothetical protein B0H13DRAFT_1929426 [Mycena leptocephala]|nr:hypothetical protein B0H13DRAFT_1929426 [Mycena leptocephala]
MGLEGFEPPPRTYKTSTVYKSCWVSDRPVSSLFRNLHTKVLHSARKGKKNPFHLYFGTCIRRFSTPQEKVKRGVRQTRFISISEPAYEDASTRKKRRVNPQEKVKRVRDKEIMDLEGIEPPPRTYKSTSAIISHARRPTDPFHLYFGTCIRKCFNPQEMVKRGRDKEIMGLEGFEPPPCTYNLEPAYEGVAIMVHGGLQTRVISISEPEYEGSSLRKKRVSDRPVPFVVQILHTKMPQPARKGKKGGVRQTRFISISEPAYSTKARQFIDKREKTMQNVVWISRDSNPRRAHTRCPTDPFHLKFRTCIRRLVNPQEKPLAVRGVRQTRFISSSEPAYEGSSRKKLCYRLGGMRSPTASSAFGATCDRSALRKGDKKMQEQGVDLEERDVDLEEQGVDSEEE